MSPSEQLSQTQWIAHVTQWRTGGLTRRAYCAEHDLKLHSLSYRIRRDRLQTVTEPALTLVQARVLPPSPKAGAPHIPECRSGCRLVIPAATQASWLGALLSALA